MLTSTVFSCLCCPWAVSLLRDWICLPVLFFFYQNMSFTSPDNRYRHVSDDFHTSSWCSTTCWGLFVSYPFVLFYNCTIIKICLKLLCGAVCVFFFFSFQWIIRHVCASFHYPQHNLCLWKYTFLLLNLMRRIFQL